MDNVRYRVGNHQPQNIYRGDQYIGVMFSPIDAAAVVNALNDGLGECTCHTYEECHGECCGVGMCSCTPVTAWVTLPAHHVRELERRLIERGGSSERLGEAGGSVGGSSAHPEPGS